ncbi:MAG: glycosyltransferase family 2 protein, partial [Planctomycetota bacterium]|nr:glycosyltransferase family 2 protein [Planctomycetota bacterium]
MVRIALCSPLPPSGTPAAKIAEQVISTLAAPDEVEVFVENPFQVNPWIVEESSLFPICDLPSRLAQRKVDVPVYLIGDDNQHVHQLRYAMSHPGVLVLLDADLRSLTAACRIVLDGLGDQPRVFIPEVGDGTEPLATVLGRAAYAIVAVDAAVAGRLRDLLGAQTEVHLLDHTPANPVTQITECARHAANQVDSIATGSAPIGPQTYPKVTALVVSYNSVDIIGPCLESLVAQDYPNLEVLVVDNASADDTAQFIRDTYPAVRVVDSGSNLGFAGGNNLGFEISDAEFFVLLNQDAIANSNFVTELLRVATLDPRVGAVAGKMLMDRCPSLINSAGSIMNAAGWGGDRRVGDKDDDPSPIPVEVFGGCGGALLLNAKALAELGGFDTKYFMYFEDTDLCWRFLAGGYRNYYAPLAVVRHDFHGDTVVDPDREFRRRFMSERNRLQTWFKNTDWQTLRRRVWQIYKGDCKRLKSLRSQSAANPDKHSPASVAHLTLKKAWRWNLLHALGIFIRRCKVQRLRTTPVAEIERLMEPGMGEGGHQGDVGVFHDRFSATPKSEITIGDNDSDCLGSGWHGVEQPPDAVAPYRWSRGRAWFYLRPTNGQDHLVLRIASPIEPREVRVSIEGVET